MYNENDFDKIDINVEPPVEEPARQYYFIAKCREWVKSFEQKNGRLPKSCVTTFGCQMNARDSEKLTGILKQAGFLMTEDENADFVIYNTCTVRDNANQKVYGRLGVLNGYFLDTGRSSTILSVSSQISMVIPASFSYIPARSSANL